MASTATKRKVLPYLLMLLIHLTEYGIKSTGETGREASQEECQGGKRKEKKGATEGDVQVVEKQKAKRQRTVAALTQEIPMTQAPVKQPTELMSKGSLSSLRPKGNCSNNPFFPLWSSLLLHYSPNHRNAKATLSRMLVSGAISDVLVVLPPSASLRLPEFRHLHAFAVSDAKNFLSGGFLKSCPPSYNTKHYSEIYNFRARGLVTRASTNSSDNLVPIAPLQFESPVGQLLEQILQTHPHLLPATIDQQLENLQTARDAHKEESSTSPNDPLYKRIAEIKEKEKRTTLEEIMYCSIVHKFLENNISMIPKISATSDPTGRVDLWPNQELKLEAVHSTEAFEMIQSHLSLVLGERLVSPLQTVVQISKIKLGKLYAASIMYGYFLNRVDERFQLERSMGTLPQDFGKTDTSFHEPPPANNLWDPDSLITMSAYDEGYDEGDYMDTGEGKSFRLRAYVMQLDAEALQRLATIRSKEAISLIEKQTQALFGRPDIRVSEDGSIETSNDEVLSLTFSGLTMLVLEAVAFGSFLWDKESYVESKYPFLDN
ncbi:hypothetical protein SESBI_07339 [Sesbania bispinosa]|nr:hypothetical protein SESBI_07339 [Sesbania bispinosa]